MGQRCRGKQEAGGGGRDCRQHVSVGFQCSRSFFFNSQWPILQKFFFPKTKHSRTDKSLQMLIKIMEALMLPGREIHA